MTIHKLLSGLGVLLVAGTLAGTAAAQAPSVPQTPKTPKIPKSPKSPKSRKTATAEIKDAKGQKVGEAKFKEGTKSVQMAVTAMNLPPGGFCQFCSSIATVHSGGPSRSTRRAKVSSH